MQFFCANCEFPSYAPFVTSFGATTDRRILLVEVRTEGLTGWGECVAGEHPYFSDETIDTAWQVIDHELAPGARFRRSGARGKVPRNISPDSRASHG